MGKFYVNITIIYAMGRRPKLLTDGCMRPRPRKGVTITEQARKLALRTGATLSLR